MRTFDHSDFDDNNIDDAQIVDHQLDENESDIYTETPRVELLLSHRNLQKSYMHLQGGAVSESVKEFEMFKFFADCGSGRSIQFIAQTFNLQVTRVNEIAKRNNWAQRAKDFDIDMLSQKLKVEKDARAIEHKQRLEEYRQQQEFIARNLANNAAKLSVLSQRTLDEYLEQDRKLDIRDIPSILNSAAKISEVAKNLQSNALGVEQLLIALEECDIDE